MQELGVVQAYCWLVVLAPALGPKGIESWGGGGEEKGNPERQNPRGIVFGLSGILSQPLGLRERHTGIAHERNKMKLTK